MIIIICFCRRINMVGDFANNFGSYVLLSEVYKIYDHTEKTSLSKGTRQKLLNGFFC